MWDKDLCRHPGQWIRRDGRCSRQWSRDSPAAHGGPRWSTRMPKGGWDLKPVRSMGSLYSSRFPSHEELQPVGRTLVGEVQENCLLWEGTHAGAGKCEESSLWGDGRCRDNVINWPQHSPHSLHPGTVQGKEVQHLRMLSPGARDRWGQGVLRFNFISHYPIWIWWAIN